ncbi:hypothetical protein E4U42_002749 [Claviceps africana]|uniref:Uncharacterized protein n=1 Tax=Claviceps africana TaxID=83212 RepID=A0A8K0JAI8_9HYPO|nr:hypothetical protein E4U42_002749 [Claviceps africana]
MPRFSVAFTKRKSASDGLDNVPLSSSDAPSFRVIDRQEVANGRSFDGGARMRRASKSFPPKPSLLDLGAEENMFADLKVNRGSNISNTTKGTSTDNSSRHSNASTTPSSADMSGPYGHDDMRPPHKVAPQDRPSQSNSKPAGSGFFDRASRTFSFGGAKKQSVPPPSVQEPVPDMPPVLSFGRENPGHAPSGDMTASTASTATPEEDQGGAMDLGGDFGSMFKGFDKRASNATLTLVGHDNAAPRSLTGNRHETAGPISPDINTPTEPLLDQRYSPVPGDSPSSSIPPRDDEPSPVLQHEHLHSFTYSSRQDDVVEDEDAKFFRESLSAMKFLSEPYDEPTQVSSNRYGDDHSGGPGQTISSGFQNEDNMFEDSMSKTYHTRASQNHALPGSGPSGNKVMTPAQFEKYRQDKETCGTTVQKTRTNANKPGTNTDDDDDDDINYDDEEDEKEKSKQQTRQRRKQEAHMAVYRQQMMKVTGETSSAVPLPTRQPARATLPISSTAPVLGYLKPPTLDPATATATASSEEDDEDVPLAILQAHGFPHKNRPPTRISPSGSSPNLLASVSGLPSGRPASMVGSEAGAPNSGRRQSNLPAFARNLPQDPFVGASIARPALRESLHFGDAKRQPSPQPPQTPLPVGGLVGVIASEERSRAMRRGSPSVDPNKMTVGGVVGQDPFAAVPSHMMYNGGGISGTPGMPGMPSMQQMPSPMLTPGDQAQIQMNQQMHQFMQMQMHFMQMMATNQNGAPMPQQTAMQPPYNGSVMSSGMMGSPSMGDVNRRSIMIDPTTEPARQRDRHNNHGPHTRTMSMVQPSSYSFIAPLGQGTPPSRVVGGAYTPSIAPSERSNVGLPGRYRPVSQAAGEGSPSRLGHHVRSNTISGDLSNWSDDKSKSTVKLLSNSGEASDDDDEQGWEAMKARREKKRSLWRGRRTTADELNIVF